MEITTCVTSVVARVKRAEAVIRQSHSVHRDQYCQYCLTLGHLLLHCFTCSAMTLMSVLALLIYCLMVWDCSQVVFTSCLALSLVWPNLSPLLILRIRLEFVFMNNHLWMTNDAAPGQSVRFFACQKNTGCLAVWAVPLIFLMAAVKMYVVNMLALFKFCWSSLFYILWLKLYNRVCCNIKQNFAGDQKFLHLPVIWGSILFVFPFCFSFIVQSQKNEAIFLCFYQHWGYNHLV